jgi:hypothetical protein
MIIAIVVPLINNLAGGFNPSEKYESQLGLLFQIYAKVIQLCSKPPASNLYPIEYGFGTRRVAPRHLPHPATPTSTSDVARRGSGTDADLHRFRRFHKSFWHM